MNFKNLASVSALICFVLALIWTFAPNVLLAMWSVDYSYPVGLVSRRGAALFAAIGIIFFLARNAEPSSARSAIVSGFIFGCFALSALGAFELVTGHAGLGILSAMCVEIALGLSFLYVASHEPMPNQEGKS